MYGSMPIFYRQKCILKLWSAQIFVTDFHADGHLLGTTMLNVPNIQLMYPTSAAYQFLSPDCLTASVYMYLKVLLRGLGQTDRWSDAQTDRWSDAQTDRWSDAQTAYKTDGQCTEWADGQRDGRTDTQTANR